MGSSSKVSNTGTQITFQSSSRMSCYSSTSSEAGDSGVGTWDRRPSSVLTETQMERICSKAPQSWQKPRSRIYDYNRKLGFDYYMPMIDYVMSKENQGVYHCTNPYESPVHLPDTTDLADRDSYEKEGVGAPDLNEFLIKGYAKQIRERNTQTAGVHYQQLHKSLSNTGFSSDNLLSQHIPAKLRRNHWLRELMVCNDRQNRTIEETKREAFLRRERAEQLLAREEEEARMNDPATVAWLRAGAQAATSWCHRTPLTKEQRRARLEGLPDEDNVPDLTKLYLI